MKHVLDCIEQSKNSISSKCKYCRPPAYQY